MKKETLSPFYYCLTLLKEKKETKHFPKDHPNVPTMSATMSRSFYPCIRFPFRYCPSLRSVQVCESVSMAHTPEFTWGFQDPLSVSRLKQGIKGCGLF